MPHRENSDPRHRPEFVSLTGFLLAGAQWSYRNRVGICGRSFRAVRHIDQRRVTARIVEAIADQVAHTLLAHVGQLRRRTGWCLVLAAMAQSNRGGLGISSQFGRWFVSATFCEAIELHRNVSALLMELDWLSGVVSEANQLAAQGSNRLNVLHVNAHGTSLGQSILDKVKRCTDRAPLHRRFCRLRIRHHRRAGRVFGGHSMTSSARARSNDGIVIPIAFAVFILMTNSNLADCSMGRLLGFSPLRMRPT